MQFWDSGDRASASEPPFGVDKHLSIGEYFENIAFKVGHRECVLSPELVICRPDFLCLLTPDNITKTHIDQLKGRNLLQTPEHLADGILLLQK
jgi:hypothetical protein